MEKYLDIIKNSYSGYWNYFKYKLIGLNHWGNYFYGLIAISLFVWLLEYVFNNPKMHIWHHAKTLPAHTSYGVNYGLTLSLWDYLFKTSYIPYSGKDIELGFNGDEYFPDTFIDRELYSLKKN